jgi:uncharacterized membrane protein YbhN (UPF0104 family)
VKQPRRLLMLVLKCSLATALIFWLVRSGRLDLRTLAGVQFGWAFLGLFVCRLVSSFLPLVRWHHLTRPQNIDFGLGTVFHIGLIAFFLGTAMPTALGFDGVRLYYGFRRNEGQREALLSTVIADRVMGLLSLVVLALLFGGVFLWQGFQDFLARPLLFLWIVLVAAAVLAAGLLRLARFWKPAARVMTAIAGYRHHKGVLAGAFVLSCIGHLSTIAGIYFTFLALRLSPPLLAICAITPLVTLSWGIPFTPMGIGIVDSVADTLYSMVHLQGGAEVTIIARVVALLVAVAGGIAYLFPVRSRNTSEGAACD